MVGNQQGTSRPRCHTPLNKKLTYCSLANNSVRKVGFQEEVYWKHSGRPNRRIPVNLVELLAPQRKPVFGVFANVCAAGWGPSAPGIEIICLAKVES
jgi:hypothetical protein